MSIMIKNSTKEVYFSKNSNNSIKYIINLEKKNLVDRWRLEKKVSLGSNLGWSFMKFGISEKKTWLVDIDFYEKIAVGLNLVWK